MEPTSKSLSPAVEAAVGSAAAGGGGGGGGGRRRGKATTTTPEVPQIPSPSTIAILRFNEYLGQYISALREVCPDSIALGLYETMFNKNIVRQTKKKEREEMMTYLVSEFHRQVAPFYDRLFKKDEGLLDEEIPILKDLDLVGQWDSWDDDTKEVNWIYLHKMAKQAQLWNVFQTMPKTMFDNLTSESHAVGQRLAKKEITMKDIDLRSIIGRIMESLSGPDIREFEEKVRSGEIRMNIVVDALKELMSMFKTTGMGEEFCETVDGLLTTAAAAMG